MCWCDTATAAAIQRHVRAVVARGQRHGRAIFGELARATDREDAQRATAAAIARIRLRHRLATSDGRAFGGDVRRRDAAAERAETQRATRDVLARIRKRHQLSKHAAKAHVSGSRAMAEVYRRLARDDERSATDRVIARLRARHRARQAAQAQARARPAGARADGAAAARAVVSN